MKNEKSEAKCEESKMSETSENKSEETKIKSDGSKMKSDESKMKREESEVQRKGAETSDEESAFWKEFLAEVHQERQSQAQTARELQQQIEILQQHIERLEEQSQSQAQLADSLSMALRTALPCVEELLVHAERTSVRLPARVSLGGEPVTVSRRRPRAPHALQQDAAPPGGDARLPAVRALPGGRRRKCGQRGDRWPHAFAHGGHARPPRRLRRAAGGGRRRRGVRRPGAPAGRPGRHQQPERAAQVTRAAVAVDEPLGIGHTSKTYDAFVSC